jgi:TrmH family RNA methyltransferase
MIITSTDNEHIKLYKKLSASAKYRRETGLFALEGLRLISDAHITYNTVFYTAAYADTVANPAEIRAERFIEISETLAEKISDTITPQGLFAIAAIANRPQCDKALGKKILVLHTVRDPGNLGTIIRTADALGISDIFAIDCADIYSPKTVRSAMGALFRVNVEKCDESAVFAKLADYETFASVLSENAETLGSFTFPEKSAIFIGNEANGLPENVTEKCTRRVTIKMRGNAESLNAAAAASILIYELSK